MGVLCHSCNIVMYTLNRWKYYMSIIEEEIEIFEIFPWCKNFETGIQGIDEQHKKLVEILNRLAGHLANMSNEIILNNIFDELAAYADYHFSSEEKIWCEYFADDSWYSEHKDTHGTFIGDVLKLKNSDKTLDETILDIVSFLSQWLAYHILDTDKRMAKGVLAMQEGLSLEDAKARADAEMQGSMRVLINTVLTMYDSLSTRTLDLMREKTLRKRAEEELKLSQERWEFVLEGGSENVWDWDIENDALKSDTELSSFEVVGRGEDTLSRIHEDDIARVQKDFQDHLDGKTEFYINKHRVLRDNGGWSWVLSRGKIVARNAQGDAIRMVGTHSDVTERELAALIYKNSSQAMFVSDVNNTIISVNPAFCKITGYCEAEIIGKSPSYISSGQHDEAFYKKLWERLIEEGSWNGEIWNRRKSGETYPEALTINAVRNVHGDIDHFVALFTDNTEKKLANDLIVEQANFDPLTKLQNRRRFQEQLEIEVHRSNRSELPFVLMFIDLDHFKEINDSLGHYIGDQLLVEVAERIKIEMRDTDILSRLGGDEFTLICPELDDNKNIERIANAIINSLSKPFKLNHEVIYISASIGLSLYPHDGANAVELLKNADQAMYLSKELGRSRFSYFTPSMQEAAHRRQQVITDLHKGIEEAQFELYYQPIVDLKSNEIIKAEALIRWNHPTRGLVMPDDFITVAEESGLIVEIGRWVYEEAMQQVKAWKEKYGIEFQISVNKSPVQFRADVPISEWLSYLDSLGLHASNCVIEITEGLLMGNNNEVADKVAQLHQSGIAISLDDFGTGYSSLSYLKKFDISFLKIDRSFVMNLSETSSDKALCEAIIVMAHTLNIKVIAEGIETQEQLNILMKMGCDYGQGYFFSRPVVTSAFEKIIERGK